MEFDSSSSSDSDDSELYFIEPWKLYKESTKLDYGIEKRQAIRAKWLHLYTMAEKEEEEEKTTSRDRRGRRRRRKTKMPSKKDKAVKVAIEQMDLKALRELWFNDNPKLRAGPSSWPERLKILIDQADSRFFIYALDHFKNRRTFTEWIASMNLPHGQELSVTAKALRDYALKKDKTDIANYFTRIGGLSDNSETTSAKGGEKS